MKRPYFCSKPARLHVLFSSITAAALAAGQVGCTGSGRMELVSLDYAAIDPPAPFASRMDFRECYWWTDERGTAWIALQNRTALPIGNEEFAFRLGFALERLPAGAARNYIVSRREMRAIAQAGPAKSRFASAAGIVALYKNADRPDELRGSFRLLVNREVNQLLGGWSRPAKVVLQGDFVAIRHEPRGKEVLQRIEFGEWAPPVSSPSTQPMTAPSTQPVEDGRSERGAPRDGPGGKDGGEQVGR